MNHAFDLDIFAPPKEEITLRKAINDLIGTGTCQRWCERMQHMGSPNYPCSCGRDAAVVQAKRFLREQEQAPVQKVEVVEKSTPIILTPQQKKDRLFACYTQIARMTFCLNAIIRALDKRGNTTMWLRWGNFTLPWVDKQARKCLDNELGADIARVMRKIIRPDNWRMESGRLVWTGGGNPQEEILAALGADPDDESTTDIGEALAR